MKQSSAIRRVVVTVAIGVSVGWCGATFAQSSSTEPKQDQSAAQPSRVFGSDAGLVLNFIKADKAADFEATIASLKQAFARSDKPERKQQAAGWKIFKAAEPGANGSVLYVFVVDPAVKGADYTVAKILAEAFPQEVNEIYKKYAESYAGGQNVVNLTLLSALGSATPSQ